MKKSNVQYGRSYRYRSNEAAAKDLTKLEKKQKEKKMPVQVSKPDAKNVMVASQCLYPDSKGLETFREDFVVVSRESGDYYVGHWLTGVGIYGVKFPKSTTRPMNDEERARFEAMNLVM